MAAKTHAEAAADLEAASIALRTAASVYKAKINDASEAFALAVETFNLAADAAGAIARDMRHADEMLDLYGPDELEFEAPEEWPVDVERATRQAALFADLDAALEDAEDARRDYADEMKHRADMSNPDRYL